jgi:hypothetical protein
MITHSKVSAHFSRAAIGAVVAILLCSVAAQPAAAGGEVVAVAESSSSSNGPRVGSDDPRILEAAAACAKAVAGNANLRGYGVILEALRQNTQAALQAAVVTLADKVTREVWNAFVQIPICAALVIDLYIEPGQVGEGRYGDVSSNFVGDWTGNITQQNPPIPPYDLHVTISRGDIGQTVAAGYYTGTSACSFYWTALSADPYHLVVNERIYSGNCFNNIRVSLELHSNGTVSYDFENGNGQGELRRP